MATVRQRRRRFYLLLLILFCLGLWVTLPKNTSVESLLQQHPNALQTQECIFNKVKISITPYLSQEQSSILLAISLESYEHSKLVHNNIHDLIIVSHSDHNILGNGDWHLTHKNDYSIDGFLTYKIENTIQSQLEVRLFMLEELLLKWPITAS